MSAPLRRLQALVLASYPTGDAGEVVHCLTPSHGRISLASSRLRGERAARLRAALQPLSLIDASVRAREGSDLVTLSDAELISSPPAEALASLPRFALASLVAEIAGTFAAPLEPAQALFDVACLGIEAAFTSPEDRLHDTTVSTLMALLDVSGYLPRIADDLLVPWPAEVPRPVVFWLNLASGLVHADLAQPSGVPVWPTAFGSRDVDLPLPPMAVRFLHRRGGNAGSLTPMEGIQTIEVLVRHIEARCERPMKSAQFWREVRGPVGRSSGA